MSLIGFYPGSFDPVTNGHVDVILRAAKFVDEIVIGVGVHHGKTPLLVGADRVHLIEQLIDEKSLDSARVVQFEGLAVDAARLHGASLIIRGVRDATDFDYEMQMAGTNAEMAGEIETVLLPSSGNVRHISAKLVRQILQLGGDITHFVPPIVAQYLADKDIS